MLCFVIDLSQNFYRKYVELGYSSEYKTDSKLKNWFRKIIALALVPPSSVSNVFEELLSEMHDAFDLVDKYKS